MDEVNQLKIDKCLFYFLFVNGVFGFYWLFNIYNRCNIICTQSFIYIICGFSSHWKWTNSNEFIYKSNQYYSFIIYACQRQNIQFFTMWVSQTQSKTTLYATHWDITTSQLCIGMYVSFKQRFVDIGLLTVKFCLFARVLFFYFVWCWLLFYNDCFCKGMNWFYLFGSSNNPFDVKQKRKQPMVLKKVLFWYG